MRYRVYNVFSFVETDMKKRIGWILIDMQNYSLIELWSFDKDFHTIPRKRITLKIIRILMDLYCFQKRNMRYLDYIRDSKLVTKEYELLPHSSSK